MIYFRLILCYCFYVYNFTHCDDLFQVDSLLLLLCVFYVRDDTVISRNNIGKVFRILYLQQHLVSKLVITT